MFSTDGMRFLESGVDWITVTCDDRQRGQRLGSIVAHVVQSERKLGNSIKPWSSFGYHGFAAGSIQSGERDDGILVRLGSYAARQHWRKVYEQATSCSRIDTQFTINLGLDPTAFVERLHKALRRAKRTNSRVPMLSVFQQDEGAATVYVGARSSDSFGRVYNKEAESKKEAYRQALRWEVEWKGARAMEIANKLVQIDDDEGGTFHLTANWFAVRGHSSVINLDHLYTPAHADIKLMASQLMAMHRMNADDERSLRWIESACQRAVARLVDHDRLPDLLKALKLDHLVQPKTNVDQS